MTILRNLFKKILKETCLWNRAHRFRSAVLALEIEQ